MVSPHTKFEIPSLTRFKEKGFLPNLQKGLVRDPARSLEIRHSWGSIRISVLH